MTLYDLYKIADDNNIEVYPYPLSPVLSMSTPGFIGMDIDNMENTAKEKECLAHELGHCMQDAFYNINTLETRGRMEYKANKWAITHMLPYHEFEFALSSGISTPWELADYFNVPESFILKAFEFYNRSK